MTSTPVADHVKTVRLLANLRTIVGGKSLNVTTGPDATVRDLFEALPQAHPTLAEKVLQDGQLAPGIQLMVNGRHIDFLQGLDTPIKDEDDLILIPPVAGG